MVHQYKNNGYNIVLDVNSGCVHVVDDVVYDIIEKYNNFLNEKKEIEEKSDTKAKLSEEDKVNSFRKFFINIKDEIIDKYDEKSVDEGIKEIEELILNQSLFTDDIYKDYIIDFKKRKTVVKALCLHIAHDCNLACKYCFAGEGEYQGDRALMSYEVGKQALDFLVANSGNRRNLEVDFFGGEPLMNFDVVKKIVAYGRELESKYDKHFRFTLTTNGILIDDDVIEFANKEMDNVVLSIDGRKCVNDKMRPTRNGKGSYDIIMPKFKKFADSRNQEKYYVRGTFTHNNLDFS